MTEGGLLLTRLDELSVTLRAHLEHLHLRVYLVEARQTKKWGAIDLAPPGDAHAWFTTHYLAPLSEAREAAHDPWWWPVVVERCMRKEEWSHPQVNVAERTLRCGSAMRQVEHPELAAAVVRFYSTMWRALDDPHVDATRLYPALEEARAVALKFVAAQRGVVGAQ